MTYDEIARHLRGTAAETMLLEAAEAGGETRSTSLEERAANDGKMRLRRLGLLVDEESLANEVGLNSDGQAVADLILRSRASGEERLDAVTREVVRASLATEGRDWRVSEVNGRSVTDNEQAMVVARLERWACATPLRRASGGISRLLPLDLMMEVPGINGLLIDHFEPRTTSHVDQSVTNTTSVTGGVVGGIQTGGGNTQHNLVTVSERVDMLEALGELLAALEADPNEKVRADVEVIQAEVMSDHPSKAVVREWAQKAFITATANGAGSAVVECVKHLVNLAFS